MDAIKKKMQAMKVEKDNAMDRSDVCEQQAKEAKIRAAKAEEEVSICVIETREMICMTINLTPLTLCLSGGWSGEEGSAAGGGARQNQGAAHHHHPEAGGEGEGPAGLRAWGLL